MLLITACAADQTVKLPTTNASHQFAGGVHRLVVVPPVIDSRTELLRIGVKKNIFGVETASVYPDRNVRVWLRQRVENELRATGFNVAVRGRSDTWQLQLELLKFFVEPVLQQASVDFETDLGIRVQVTQGDVIVAERRYLTKGLAHHAGLGEKTYTPSLEEATDAFVARLIPDFLALMKQFPTSNPSDVPP
jgi:uncharacterized lipoprotein YajG